MLYNFFFFGSPWKMPRLPLVEGLHNDDGVNRKRSGPQMLAGWLAETKDG
jgi:hypothetical protein